MSTARLAQLPRDDGVGDLDLVSRIRAGEKSLYAVMMRRHNQRLYRLARGIVRDDAEAEDVVQQVYITVFRKLDQFRAESSLSTWLSRIAINEALGRLRKTNRHGDMMVLEESKDAAVSDRPADPEEETFRKEMGATLEQQIDALPQTLRVAFIMRDVEELTTSETAELLGISDEAVRVRLHRARQLLQSRLTEVMADAPDAFRFAGTRCDRIVLAVVKALNLCLPREVVQAQDQYGEKS